MTKKRFPLWTIGLVGILLLILVPVLYFLPRAQAKNNPAGYIPEKPVHVDHKDIVNGEFKTGQDGPAPVLNVMKTQRPTS